MRYWRLTPSEASAIDDITYKAMVDFMVREAREIQKAAKRR